MCERSNSIIGQCTTKEANWKSMTTASEKVEACRRQIMRLEDPIPEVPSNDTHLSQHHYARLSTDSISEYRKQRIESVKSLLKKNEQLRKRNATYIIETDLVKDSYFELKCSNEYVNFESQEMEPNMLQQTKKLLFPEKLRIMDGNKPGTSRSCMEKFLQAKTQTECCLTSETATNISQRNEEGNLFRTAREMLITNNLKKQTPFNKYKAKSAEDGVNTPKEAYFNYGVTKKVLGTRRTVRSGYVLPNTKDGSGTIEINPSPHHNQSPTINCSPEMADERLINIDPKMVDLIRNEIMHKYKPMDWSDIAGLEYVKSVIKEAVVYPLLRPDIFTGLRRPPRGILLFGPPGTGKTLIGKCIASQSNSTFFSISASSLTSKWVGESEKMVRALFSVAAVYQPSVVFIDEVDSLLSKRSESEHDSSRKLKNEFLVQLDGAATSEDDRVVIVGATNRPQELDDAARRRFARRLYIPLPEIEARIHILKKLLATVSNNINEENINEIGQQTGGYSGADMDILCREASMEPLRAIPADQIVHIAKDEVRPVNLEDFKCALHSVRPSVSGDDLAQYIKWNKEYGALQKI